MKRICLLIVVLFVGCVHMPQPIYSHPTKNQDDYRHDKYECKVIIEQALHNEYGDDWFSAGLDYQDKMKECLEMKFGWRQTGFTDSTHNDLGEKDR